METESGWISAIGFFWPALYMALLFHLLEGQTRVQRLKGSSGAGSTKFSVIIPVRNEADNIVACLRALAMQTLSWDQFEVIVVDDESNDNTVQVAQEFLKDYPGFPYRILQADLQSPLPPGKKRALATGINAAKHPWIITTDGDTVGHPHWLKTMAAARTQSNANLLIGPVNLAPGKNLLGRLQSVEWAALVGVTAGSAGKKHPILANGANLAFSKAAYEKIGGYQGSSASGDDVFLLHAIKKHLKQPQIVYVRDPDAMVTTPALTNLSDFFRQRIRWAAKSRLYRDPFALLISFIIVGFNLWLVAFGVLCLLGKAHVFFLLLTLFCKLVLDIFFAVPQLRFLGHTPLWIWLVPLQLIYPLYITFTTFRSIGGTFSWKGRRHRT